MKRSTLGLSLLGLLLAAAMAATAVTFLANRVHLRNPRLLLTGDPEKIALVVYHPGLSNFPERVVEGFTRGLQASGWSAEIWTASDSTPSDLTRFDLLVLGSPIYYWAPSRPMQRYIGRLGDLRGKDVAIILTGMGAGARATGIMERLVREARGELVSSLTLYSHNPNDQDNYEGPSQNQDLAVEMAERAGRKIPLPAR